MLYTVLKPVTAALAGLLFRVRGVGVEHVPVEGPLLLAANHLSFLDPPVIAALVPRQVHFMAKAELFRVPLLAGFLGRLNAHPVDREGSDASAVRLALGLLREGRALLVFPEGTRGVEGRLGPGRAGAGMLAAHSQAPVVPVYVRGTGHALPRGRVIPRPSRVTVAYGAPLRFARERGKARYQAISDEIMAAIGRLKAEVMSGTAWPAMPPAIGEDRRRTTQGQLPAGRIH